MVAKINCNLPLPFICTNLRLDAKANNVSAGPFFNTLLHKTSELPLQISVHLILIRLHVFFTSNTFFFFNSASVLLNFFMNRASNVALVLLNAYKHHYTKTHFILSIFLSMSRSTYVIFVIYLFSTSISLSLII